MRRLWMLVVLSGCRIGFDPVPFDDVDSGEPSEDATTPPPDHFPSYVLHEFRGLWNLPHTIGWGWSCSGTIPTFDHYELCYARLSDLNDLNCLEPEDDPTLGFIECGGETAFHPGIVGGLELGTDYRAFVRVYDAEGNMLESKTAAFSTAPEIPARTLEIFEDECDCTLQNFEVVQGALLMHAPGEDWVQSGLANMAITPDGLDEVSFGRAYLELLVDAPHPARVWTWFGRGGRNLYYAPPAGHSPVDGVPGYQTLEVPVARMLWGEGTNPAVPTYPVTFDDFAGFDLFGIGSRWGTGDIHVDEIRLRW